MSLESIRTFGEKDFELENYDNITLYSIDKVFGNIRILIIPRGRAGEQNKDLFFF